MPNSLVDIKQNSEQCSLFLFVLIVCMLGITACKPQAPRQQEMVFSGPIMGTEYRITVVAEFENDRGAEIESAVVNAMSSVNQSMSNYIADSEISRFNRLAAHQPQTLSSDFAAVMSESLSVSELSKGAFDVTLARAIDAWGFGPDGKITRRPSQQQLELLRETVGYDKLSLEEDVLMKRVGAIEISLSAIAKGYAVDKVALTLESLGLPNYLVNIGGELRASGRSVDNKLWRVGIEKPHILGGIQAIAELDNVSIATSGDYRNYLVLEGQQFSHTIDPKTLTPVYHKLALVSVISQRASTADALATAMMAMGEKQAWTFALENNLAAYLILRGDTEGEYKVQSTEKFRAYLQ